MNESTAYSKYVPEWERPVITALCKDNYIERSRDEWRLKDPDTLLTLTLSL